MKNILTLLERFFYNLNKNVLIKENISKIIEEKTKIKLLSGQINLKDGILEINTGGTVKNEINLKEEVIKKELGFQNIKIFRILYK